MFSPLFVVGAMFAYIALLFFLARLAERTRRGRVLANHPFTYALALSVYCTTWTYYGSVGRAATGGMGAAAGGCVGAGRSGASARRSARSGRR